MAGKSRSDPVVAFLLSTSETWDVFHDDLRSRGCRRLFRTVSAGWTGGPAAWSARRQQLVAAGRQDRVAADGPAGDVLPAGPGRCGGVSPTAQHRVDHGRGHESHTG